VSGAKPHPRSHPIGRCCATLQRSLTGSAHAPPINGVGADCASRYFSKQACKNICDARGSTAAVMLMIRQKFDQIISMNWKKQVFVLFCFILLVVLISSFEFVQPPLPLTQYHDGPLADHEMLLSLLFIIWVLAFAFGFNYFLVEFSVAENKPVFRKIVVENAGSVFLIVLIVIHLSIGLFGYLNTGIVCLLGNSYCLQFGI
jgi:hypothetical protein